MYEHLTAKLITEKGFQYRERLKEKFWNYLLIDPSAVWRESLLKRLESKDELFVPEVSIPEGQTAVDTLCALLRVGDSMVAILHGRETTEGPEGVGRTSLLLKALGVSFDYDRIVISPQERLRVPFEIHKRSAPEIKLLTSDFAYITNLRETLSVLPVQGEPILGLWDICRHIYRIVQKDYQPGLRLTPQARTALCGLMNALKAGPILELYDQWKEYYPINVAVVLRVQPQILAPVTIAVGRSREEKLAVLREAFNSVLYLTCPFWARDENAHRARVDSILSGLTELPTTYTISVPLDLIDLGDKRGYSEKLCEKFIGILGELS